LLFLDARRNRRHQFELGQLVDPDSLMRTQVLQEDGAFVCKLCSRRIKQRSHMKRHMKDTHLKPNQYRCPCDKWYNNRSALYQHVVKHHRDLGVINLDDFLVDNV
jgi:hypothetical protein